MEKVKVIFDKEANTLTVWFEDPVNEAICEETGEEVILMKDAGGHVIGFEKLNYSHQIESSPQIIFETAMV